MNRHAWISLRSIPAALDTPLHPFPSKESHLWGAGLDLPPQVLGPGRAVPWGPRCIFSSKRSPSTPSLDDSQDTWAPAAPEHTLLSMDEETEAQSARGKGRRNRGPPLSCTVPPAPWAPKAPRFLGNRPKLPGAQRGGRAGGEKHT